MEAPTFNARPSGRCCLFSGTSLTHSQDIKQVHAEDKILLVDST
jgi:hypothetical protein